MLIARNRTHFCCVTLTDFFGAQGLMSQVRCDQSAQMSVVAGGGLGALWYSQLPDDGSGGRLITERIGCLSRGEFQL